MAVTIKVKGNQDNRGLYLEFDWDEESGKISGKQEKEAVYYLSVFGGTRTARVIPDWSIPCDLPYKSKAGMAAALHHCFDIPDWLAEHLPALPESESIDVDVVY